MTKTLKGKYAPTIAEIYHREWEKQWEAREQLKHQEIVKLFAPQCIPIINQQVILTTREITDNLRDRKKFLSRRKEFSDQGCEWILSDMSSWDDGIIELERKKKKHIRDLYFAQKRGDEKNLGNDFFDKVEIARETNIVDVIRQYEHIEKTGDKRWKCKCPFHKDSNPSLVIYEDTNSFYCFSCNEGGDVIDWEMKYNNLSFVEAIKKLSI